ncbi:hypothetical protein [Aureispira anguillae]|uniref:Lipoprotein n=1 Tax=Aureispira anguillae TaxID=2864201 RepID=A0A915YF64_9BACT|nr:hypothetical protein [Aureispira anguillae]BDS12002.1 hypothetical protein AsAng_0027170 [Aureispira anguillae]
MKQLLLNSLFAILVLCSCEKNSKIDEITNVKTLVSLEKSTTQTEGINVNSNGFVFEVGQTEEFLVDKMETGFSAYKMTCILDENGVLNISREEIFMELEDEVALGENMIIAPIQLTAQNLDGYKATFDAEILSTLRFIPFDPNDDVIEAYTGGTVATTAITCSCVNTAPSSSNDCEPTKVMNIHTGKISIRCRGCARCESNERTFQARMIVSISNGSSPIKQIKFIN